MTFKETEFPRSFEYRTGKDFEPINFFIDTFSKALQADILLGYFSTSAISVLSLSFAKFISSGGNVRFIINNILSSKDKALLLKATSYDTTTTNVDLTNFKELIKTFDEYSVHFFECLAYLIKNRRIQFKIITPAAKKGISHFKSGIFTDKSGNKVSFKGSSNFTASALLENLEEIAIKVSWEEINKPALEEYQEYYNFIFDGNADYVDYLDESQIIEVIRGNFKEKELNELIVDEIELINKRSRKQRDNIRLNKSITNLLDDLERYMNEPRFPFPHGPREYQLEAFDKWNSNGKKGIFAMATGTGKTITSLNCLLEEYKATGVYRALILVPTNTLVEQWEKEAGKFNFRNSIIKISSRFQWQKELDMLLTSLEFGSNESFIIITTYASFHRPRLQHILKQLPSNTLLIADEAHNISSPKMLEVFPNVHLQKRLALSATPKRAYDPEGTEAMERFFDDKEPYSYNFSMERAINEEVLCKYFYYPRIVYLTEVELQEYVEVSKKLSKFFNAESDNLISNEIVTQLLMKRKRIIHKAENKLTTFKQILRKELDKRGSLKYTFVYVPEGYRTIEGEDDQDEEVRIINEYTQAVMQTDPAIKVSQFLSETEDKEEILNLSAQGKIDVLASMKCLDEGVDVPRTELAIFCASTGNPRQFIQRRGRVLRQHPDKHLATIYDMIVLPDPSSSTAEDANFKLERNLVKKELERVAHFAFMAINRYEAIEVFEEICKHYNLDIYTIHETLSEG